jgi:hypothetical protein
VLIEHEAVAEAAVVPPLVPRYFLRGASGGA